MKRAAPPDGLTIDVRACLALPEFSEAVILSGSGRLDAPVSWVSVIEWPVEHFVSRGDLVLTTGVGCTEEQLCEMVQQAAESGATAVCIGTGPGAIHESLGRAVVDTAEACGITLIALPWRVRFSDLSRAVIGALHENAATQQPGALPVEFTRALLGPSGITGVADALEQVIDAPVVILDDILTIAGSGRRGAEWLALPATESALIDAMFSLAERHGALGPGETRTVRLSAATDREPLASELVGAPAMVNDRVLGWVLAVPAADADRQVLARAIAHAGTAAAIEMLRKVADDEAATRERERFVWEVARGSLSSPLELAARGSLFGLSAAWDFTVGIAVVEPGGGGQSAPEATLSARTVANQLRRRLTHPSSAVAVRDREILICIHEHDAVTMPALFDALPPELAARASWGVAARPHALPTFPKAVAEARTASRIARSLWGPGHLGDAGRLGSYLLLAPLAQDPDSIALTDDILGRLESADSAKGSQLVATLDAYLQSNGNVSSTARLLHLNRHSLIYRLQRISELTGMDPNTAEERMLLGMALRIRRLRVPSPPAGPDVDAG